jgi:predicted nucleic acid-binding protein
MIILDTNVISEFTRPVPSQTVMNWFQAEDPENFFTTTITEAEILAGLALLPDGKRKTAIWQEIEAMFGILVSRIFGFDRDAAQTYPLVILQRRASGFATDTADGQIAAIARAQGAAIATRNTADFAHCGVEIINPWTA